MNKKHSLFPLFSVVFVDMLGFGIILPLLPYIAANWGATPFMIGLIGAAYPLGQFFGAPLVGILSDRFGRKPLLLFSIAGTFLSLVMLGFAQSIAIIMISRFFDGLTGGNITVAQAYISDVTDEKSRSKGMGNDRCRIWPRIHSRSCFRWVFKPMGVCGACICLRGFIPYEFILDFLPTTRIASERKTGAPFIGSQTQTSVKWACHCICQAHCRTDTKQYHHF